MTQDTNDPTAFIRTFWRNFGVNIPGGPLPTFDTEELQKHIADMKTVEGWLKLNLNMLQASIQGLEMQLATIQTAKTMHDSLTTEKQASSQNPKASDTTAPNPGNEKAPNAFIKAAQLWPWNFAAFIPPETQISSPKQHSTTAADQTATTKITAKKTSRTRNTQTDKTKK